MIPLPKRYTKVARSLTGYWGTYPITRALAPGDIGRKVDGVFERQRCLADFAEFALADHPVYDESRGAADQSWTSTGASRSAVELGLPASGTIPVGAQVRFSFTQDDSAVIVCRNASDRGFSDLVPVRRFVLDLWASGQWEKDWILVTDVLAAEAAAVAFATERGQSVSLRVTADLPVPGIPVSLALDPSVSIVDASSWFGRVDTGCTPLFSALQLHRSILPGSRPSLAAATKGPDGAFEEPEFGETASED